MPEQISVNDVYAAEAIVLCSVPCLHVEDTQGATNYPQEALAKYFRRFMMTLTGQKVDDE